MAERRMLTRKITNHDDFTKLPATAQALYLHLVMSADDDGFCDQASTAMFRAHAKPKDLNLLLDQHYLIKFDSGVLCIKHWRMANAGRSDRYTPTVYQEEYRQLTLKENKSYTMATNGSQGGNQVDTVPDTKSELKVKLPDTTGIPSGNQVDTIGIPSVYQTAPQKRREENRREENNISVCDTRARVREREDEKDDGFQAFWSAYPKKNGGDIREAFLEYEHVRDSLGVDKEILIKAATELAEATEPEEIRYLPNAAKWLRNRGWESKVKKKAANKNAPVGVTQPKQIDTGQLAKVQELICAGRSLV